VKSKVIDTNVIIRFLVESPDKVQSKFKGVYSFFERLEQKEISAELPELVLFESFFLFT
jgi:predicted nucleic-acid-binding protein